MAKAKSVTLEEFVTIWATAGSVAEVVEKTGYSKQSVQAKSTALRKAGVRLKKFRRPTQEIDVDALNAILKKHDALEPEAPATPKPKNRSRK